MTHARIGGPLPAPPDRGPLLDAAQVAELIGGNPPPTPKWVREHVPAKLTLGHSTVRWFRDDVLRWLESLRTPPS